MPNPDPIPVYVVRRTSPLTWGCAVFLSMALIGGIAESFKTKTPTYNQSSTVDTPAASPTPNQVPGIIQDLRGVGFIITMDKDIGKVVVNARRWYGQTDQYKKDFLTLVSLYWPDLDKFYVDVDKGTPVNIASYSRQSGIRIFDKRTTP